MRVTNAGEGFKLDKTMIAGEVFGLIALLDGGRRSASCTAETEVTIAALPATAFQLLESGNVPLALRFQSLIAGQLAGDARMLNGLLRQSLESGERPATP